MGNAVNLGSGTLDITGLTAADLAVGDEWPIYDISAAGNRKATVEKLGGFLLPIAAGGRLTLLTATGVPTADQTAKLVLFYTPGQVDWGGHDRIGLFDGTRWNERIFAELSIKSTDSAQTGTMTSGNKIISGLTDTSQLVRGMPITGTSVGAASVIATIDSATQVTGTVNSTGSTTNAVTFKLAASTAYDVYAIDNAGAAKLQFSNPWTNVTTRADALGLQDSVLVNNAAINAADSNTIAAKRGRLLGSIVTTATAGQLEDSASNRLVANIYNRERRHLQATDTTDTWNYSTDTWQEANAGSTLGTSRVGIFLPLAGWFARAVVLARCFNAGSNRAGVGVGIDSSTVNSAQIRTGNNLTSYAPCAAEYLGYPGLGYHTLRWLERVTVVSSTTTWSGDQGGNPTQSGLLAEVLA